METKNKKCCMCGNYNAYYTKGYCHFDKQKKGFCYKQQEIKENQDGCEFWRSNYHKRSERKTVATKMLTDILTYITELKQIFEEEQEENETDPLPRTDKK